MIGGNATESSDFISEVVLSFSWIDYALFSLMFGLSAIIGIYYGCFGNKQSTTEDYLLGGKNMKIFPVAMSLAASNLSGISLLGIPAEVYMNGTQYVVCIFSVIPLIIIVNTVYLPVFYKLQLNSAYEYLELRFSKKIRLIASGLFVITTMLYLPIVIYVPALAYNQVTGMSIYIITPVISLVCIFYTTIGGLKAVVWTDTLQFSITLLTLTFVLLMGTISVGGFSEVWEKAAYGDRLVFFNMDLNPTLRASFWSVCLGQLLNWMSSVGCSPASVQRFMAIPTMQGAKRALVIFAISTIFTKVIMCFSGLILFAKYYDCDPFTSGRINKSDQILPYYVLDVAKNFPGISGLFVAGVFSTALSTLSTFLNTLSGIVYTDFISPFLPAETSEKKASNIMKTIVVILGVVCIGLVFIVDKVGAAVLELNLAVSGCTLGPLVGLFTMGMLFPIANEKGAIFGSLTAFTFMIFILIKSQLYNYNHSNVHLSKPLHTYGCSDSNFTHASTDFSYFTTPTSVPNVEEDPMWIFRISFYYYAAVGAVLTIMIGLPFSWFTKPQKHVPLDANLLSPVVHKFLPKPDSEYTSIENGIKIITRKENNAL